jgi:hypothetical protein
VSMSPGAMARFASPDELMSAIRKLRESGLNNLEAYTPFPIHGIDEALGRSRSKLPWVVLAGGLFGAGIGYFVQWYLSVVEYPIIVGGKPFDSREAWIPITFEMTILFASFAAIGGMCIFNKLPRLHCPLFDAPEFARATNDGFFLTVSETDGRADPRSIASLLVECGGHDVTILDLED